MKDATGLTKIELVESHFPMNGFARFSDCPPTLSLTLDHTWLATYLEHKLIAVRSMNLLNDIQYVLI